MHKLLSVYPACSSGSLIPIHSLEWGCTLQVTSIPLQFQRSINDAVNHAENPRTDNAECMRRSLESMRYGVFFVRSHYQTHTRWVFAGNNYLWSEVHAVSGIGVLVFILASAGFWNWMLVYAAQVVCWCWFVQYVQCASLLNLYFQIFRFFWWN